MIDDPRGQVKVRSSPSMSSMSSLSLTNIHNSTEIIIVLNCWLINFALQSPTISDVYKDTVFNMLKMKCIILHVDLRTISKS